MALLFGEVIPVSAPVIVNVLPLLVVPITTLLERTSTVLLISEFLIVEAAFTIVSESSCTSSSVVVSLIVKVPVKIASIVSSPFLSPLKVITPVLLEKFNVLSLYDLWL